MIIFRVGREEERGSQCVRPGGLKTKLPGGDLEGSLLAGKSPLGLRSKLCSWKEMLLITEKKRLNLAGPEKIIGKTCMNLKASFIHVTMSPPERLRWETELPEKNGKMVWTAQPNPETIPDFCLNSKISRVSLHQIFPHPSSITAFFS